MVVEYVKGLDLQEAWLSLSTYLAPIQAGFGALWIYSKVLKCLPCHLTGLVS